MTGHGDSLCHITENNLRLGDAGVHGDMIDAPVSVDTSGVSGGKRDVLQRLVGMDPARKCSPRGRRRRWTMG